LELVLSEHKKQRMRYSQKEKCDNTNQNQINPGLPSSFEKAKNRAIA
jgi:hypothetical protein